MTAPTVTYSPTDLVITANLVYKTAVRMSPELQPIHAVERNWRAAADEVIAKLRRDRDRHASEGLAEIAETIDSWLAALATIESTERA
jgi:hypothetical protein